MAAGAAGVGPVPSTTTAAVGAFAAMASDPTGTVTFERYLWQAKLAVRSWLSTLAPDGPLAVVAEHVEDLVVVEADRFRFAQLKTRDKGSWTATKICGDGHAASKLVASYLAAKAAGLTEISCFEVWLEGPQSTDAKTTTFFADPTKAHADIKAKIRGMGLKGASLTDFLSRLQVRCQQPSRQFIDAVVMRVIGATWTHLQYQQIADLYEQLLTVATAAQAASEPPAVVRQAITTGRLDPYSAGGWEPIQPQALLREQLRALCPPLASASNEELFRRAATGTASLLELKLIRAGAGKQTVAAAIGARADAEIATTGALSSGRVDADDIEAFDARILTMAGSVAALGRVNGASAAAPAEHVFHTLMTRPADVGALDSGRVVESDHRLVVGRLCSLSDQCRFSWGTP